MTGDEVTLPPVLKSHALLGCLAPSNLLMPVCWGFWRNIGHGELATEADARGAFIPHRSKLIKPKATTKVMKPCGLIFVNILYFSPYSGTINQV